MSSTRRDFMQGVGAAVAAGAVWPAIPAATMAQTTPLTQPAGGPADAGAADRAYWLTILKKLAAPVLDALSRRELRKRLPVEQKGTGREACTHLEAVGRLLAGIAPWLESGATDGPEGALRRKLAEQARAGLDAGADPASPDMLNFDRGGQPLVDAAFLAHALIRAPRELWEKLDDRGRKNLVAGLKASRKIKPGRNNWLCFSAMVEAALHRCGEPYLPEPVATSLKEHEAWYKGDGVDGDGPAFHFDYYNSFVIHPMLIDITQALAETDDLCRQLAPRILDRAQRYAAIQERLIAPDGTFPVVGRSIAYRCGAFQLLSQIALRRELPAALKPAQVRAALTAVIHRTLDAPGTFDDQGFLRIGLCGRQPSLGESYISTGSLYLCATALLPLGLPVTDPFWQGHADWTARKVWSGQDLPADSALKGS